MEGSPLLLPRRLLLSLLGVLVLLDQVAGHLHPVGGQRGGHVADDPVLDDLRAKRTERRTLQQFWPGTKLVNDQVTLGVTGVSATVDAKIEF